MYLPPLPCDVREDNAKGRADNRFKVYLATAARFLIQEAARMDATVEPYRGKPGKHH